MIIMLKNKSRSRRHDWAVWGWRNATLSLVCAIKGGKAPSKVSKEKEFQSTFLFTTAICQTSSQHTLAYSAISLSPNVLENIPSAMMVKMNL